MAEGLKWYWFVAAVFREPRDLVATIAELRGNGFEGNRLLVVANHRAEDTRKEVDGSGDGRVRVVDVRADGAIKATSTLDLPAGLSALLNAMREGDVFERRASDGGAGPADESRSQVYAQLRQDVAEGAVVLIASVDDPDAQLLGARILLRGNCECVLTHEIAVHDA